MTDFLDVADKLSSVGAFVIALIVFARDLRRGNDAQQRAELHQNDDQQLPAEPEPPQPSERRISRADAFRQHRDFKEGMFLPVPLFIEMYTNMRRQAISAIFVGVLMFGAFAWTAGGLPPFPSWILPIIVIGCGIWLMRIAANRIDRRFPD